MARPGFQVEYDHEAYSCAHTVTGAFEALQILCPDGMPRSLLDVGCGTGTWLQAAQALGTTDLLGVDGADLPSRLLHIEKDQRLVADLNQPLRLNRRFELVLCLETAEHLKPDSAGTIIDSLTAHGDRILFSAAVPGQRGSHHVNCHWPGYWQDLFNARGFACDDSPRWAIWDNRRIEPWYRQNMFVAVRNDNAGKERRIMPVVHPDMLDPWSFLDFHSIETGALPWSWYARVLASSAAAKLRRRLGRSRPISTRSGG